MTFHIKYFSLFCHVQLMWVKFNSTNRTSRHIADKNKTETFNRFIHLMWHPGVIDIELDIVEMLGSTLQGRTEILSRSKSIPLI